MLVGARVPRVGVRFKDPETLKNNKGQKAAEGSIGPYHVPVLALTSFQAHYTFSQYYFHLLTTREKLKISRPTRELRQRLPYNIFDSVEGTRGYDEKENELSRRQVGTRCSSLVNTNKLASTNGPSIEADLLNWAAQEGL